jgi:ligand-binding SRPBCC domain-containing protein
MNIQVYKKSSVFKTTMERMIAFHQAPQALQVLTPPPIFVQVIDDNRLSLRAGDVRFRLWFGFVPIEWHARHEAASNAESFVDVMVEGPMAYWRHEHLIEADGDFIRLTDTVSLAHKAGWRGLLTGLVFDGIPLRILFYYRHLRTKWTVEHD